jgi:SAM-dependent methyltransferase
MTACLIAEDYGSMVHGIDLSEIMINKAQQRAQQRGFSGRVEFRVADVFELPFDDDWFDITIAESVLTPLPGDKTMAMREVVRVLQPGGVFAVNEPIIDPESPPEVLALLAQHPAFHGHFTPKTLYALFEESGLDVVDSKEVWDADVPKPRIGLGGLLKFMVQVYPTLLRRLLRDSQIRAARKIDDDLMKGSKDYMGYTIILGRKPGAIAE